ncbi:hypothetical protein XENTR_v10004153 [Xenopus tropicalis]|nr:hypothetical protein XENTR_v10004153 [Xenopus tropicalis]
MGTNESASEKGLLLEILVARKLCPSYNTGLQKIITGTGLALRITLVQLQLVAFLPSSRSTKPYTIGVKNGDLHHYIKSSCFSGVINYSVGTGDSQRKYTFELTLIASGLSQLSSSGH